MPIEDKQLRRRAEREIAKFPLDMTRLTLRATGDTIHFEGRVRLMRGSAGAKGSNLDSVLLAVEETLRSLPQVRDVVMSNLVREY